MNYRIAYLGHTMVNWCPKLGTVLANDEVSEGLSIRGGYPVEQKLMYQWCLRVSAYAGRLLDGLDSLDWTDSLKETQRNWIGRSEGAEMRFKVDGSPLELEIFTTRADTVFGVTFMVLAPESAYVDQVTAPECREAVANYLAEVRHKTERERMIDKKVTGVFTGSYAINPLSGKRIPIWVSDYVLAGYGTGAIMAVPAHDSRDYAFARHFDLPVIPLIEGADVSKESFDAKSGKMINSCSAELDLNGMEVKDAIAATKNTSPKKESAKSRSTTGSATPFSAASDTGANRSPSTTATESPACYRRNRCRCNCRKSTSISPPKKASRHWAALKTGPHPKAIRLNSTPCPDSPDQAHTTCAIWTRTTTGNW